MDGKVRSKGSSCRSSASSPDFDVHYGSQDFTACNGFDCVIFNSDVTQHDYLFGPRASVSVGKFRPFAELLSVSHADAHLIGSDSRFRDRGWRRVDYRVGQTGWPGVSRRLYSQQFVQQSAEQCARLSVDGIVLHFIS
jgi:hypothetical protein